MKEENNFSRSMTISTKVLPSEKVILQKQADELGISLSELIYLLTMNFKDCYDYIGSNSPKEEKLIKEVETFKKANNKLISRLENAENRLEIEINLRKESEKETNQLRYKNV